MDPYLQPNGVLKNKLGIANPTVLARFETDSAAVREVELRQRMPTPPFTFETLREIHRQLFQDVYEWAGEPRTIQLSKADYEGPGAKLTRFAEPHSIRTEARAIFQDLADQSNLTGRSRATFAAQAARLFVKVNNPHWAREGNGRTQRVLFEAIGSYAGHLLAFDVVTHERMVAASIDGARGHTQAMEELFHDASDPVRVAALREAIAALRRGAPQTWNQVHVAATVCGRTYRGILAGIAKGHYMLRVNDGSRGAWLAFGDASDLAQDARTGTEVNIIARHFRNDDRSVGQAVRLQKISRPKKRGDDFGL